MKISNLGLKGFPTLDLQNVTSLRDSLSILSIIVDPLIPVIRDLGMMYFNGKEKIMKKRKEKITNKNTVVTESKCDFHQDLYSVIFYAISYNFIKFDSGMPVLGH